MYANVKKIKKPHLKEDFFMPSGEPVPPDRCFPFTEHSRRFWQFKNLSITRGYELVREGVLIIRPRFEIRAELRKTFRSGSKVSSKTWHLALILEKNISNPIKCAAFWKKIDDKLKNFELSREEENKIRSKIEAYVPRPSGGRSG